MKRLTFIQFATLITLLYIAVCFMLEKSINGPSTPVRTPIPLLSSTPTELPKEKSATPTSIPTPTMTVQVITEPTQTVIFGPTLIPAPTGMFGAPSLWPADINQILEEKGSPAAGNGVVFWELGLKYGIDPAYLLAFFAKESSYGTDPNWSGRRYQTRNIGNIICTANWKGECGGRFRKYPSWEAAAEDWYSLMSRKYQGLSLDEMLAIYAPASDGNNPVAYAKTVRALVTQWRTR